MLKAKKKITKQELERDPVLAKTVELEQFIRHHTKPILIGASIVVLVIVAFLFINKSFKTKTLNASGELGLAQLSVQQGDVEDGILRLEEIISNYGTTNSAGAAHIMLGQIYLEKGDLENAEKYYSDYNKKYKDNLAKSAVFAALGVCAESKGDFKEAVVLYEKAVKTARYEFQKQIAQLKLLNAYLEAKDIASSERLINELEDEELEYSSKNKLEMLSAKLAVLQR